MGLTETQFGALFIPFIAGYIAGALCSGRFAGRVLPHTQLRLSLTITATVAALSVGLSLVNDPAHMLTQQIVLAVTAFGVQLGAPILTLRALDLFPAYRGSVSSLLAFVQLAGASLVLGLAPLIQHDLRLINLFSLFAAISALACARQAVRTGRKVGATSV